jgi:hypothetical protein
VGDLEEVQEAKVDTFCLVEDVVRRAVEALKRSVFTLSCLIASIYDRFEYTYQPAGQD